MFLVILIVVKFGEEIGLKLFKEMKSVALLAVLPFQLIDRKCRYKSPVALVDLAVRSFPGFFLKFALMRNRISYKDPPHTHRGYSAIALGR